MPPISPAPNVVTSPTTLAPRVGSHLIAVSALNGFAELRLFYAFFFWSHVPLEKQG